MDPAYQIVSVRRNRVTLREVPAIVEDDVSDPQSASASLTYHAKTLVQ